MAEKLHQNGSVPKTDVQIKKRILFEYPALPNWEIFSYFAIVIFAISYSFYKIVEVSLSYDFPEGGYGYSETSWLPFFGQRQKVESYGNSFIESLFFKMI